jgi:ABC-type bacteriocin/lantibiotic exporter with double-glycine peptidase domain
MVLKHWGREVSLDEVVARLPMAEAGTSAAAILQLARFYGLKGRGGQVQVDRLCALPPFSILHWQHRHFVVLQRATRSRIRILDPARGIRSLSLLDARAGFSGVALIFSK